MNTGLWLILLVIARAGMSQSTEVEQIVTRYFEAKGGVEAWGEIRSIEKEFDLIKYKLPIGQTPRIDTSHFLIFFLKPHWYKQIRTQEANTSILCLDNNVFWRQSGTDFLPTIESSDEIPYVKSTLALVGVEDLFLDTTASILFMGQKQLEGKEYNVLRGKRINWIFPYDYYFDEDSGLLFCSESTVNGLRTYFREYRSVDGLMFHFSEEIYDATGTIVSRTLFRSLKINAPMQKNLFKFPN